MKSLIVTAFALTTLIYSSAQAGGITATAVFKDAQGKVIKEAQRGQKVPLVLELHALKAESVKQIRLNPISLQTDSMEAFGQDGTISRVCTNEFVEHEASSVDLFPNSENTSDHYYENLKIESIATGSRITLDLIPYSAFACEVKEYSIHDIRAITDFGTLNLDVVNPGKLKITQ